MAQPAADPSVTLVLRGEPERARRIKDALPGPGLVPVHFEVTTLPSPRLRPAQGNSEERLAAARKDYVRAEFGSCLKRLGEEELVASALFDGSRVLASRLLLWRVACLVGTGKVEAARRAARTLGVLGLEVPGDVGTTNPEVEAILARAISEVGRERLFPVRIESEGAEARVSIDGRQRVCTTPCAVDLPEGDHVLRLDAEGRTPVTRIIRAGQGQGTASAELRPAPPAVAAEQWVERYGPAEDFDSDSSLRLLSTALRAPRLLLLVAEADGSSTRLRGVLAVDQSVTARGERKADGELKEEVPGLLRDLLVKGGVVEPAPPLYKRASFWVAVGIAAAAAAGGTLAIVSNRNPRTGVEL